MLLLYEYRYCSRMDGDTCSRYTELGSHDATLVQKLHGKYGKTGSVRTVLVRLLSLCDYVGSSKETVGESESSPSAGWYFARVEGNSE